MRSKIFICTIYLLGINMFSFAQNTDIIFPSPEAMSFIKNINIPVDNFTGNANISIPITNLTTKDIEVPLSLLYNTSGIKVAEVSSWVGLGWNLRCGGMITRVVRGRPDEDSNGYCGINNIGNLINEKSHNQTKDDLHKIANKEWDSEPDLFFFSFNGRSGRFVHTAIGNSITIPKQNIKISSPFKTGDDYWVLTDEKGNEYYYGLELNSREWTISQINNEDITSAITTWHLSKIVSPSGNTIFFNYETEKNIVRNKFKRYFKVNELKGTDCCDNSKLDDYSIATAIIDVKYLSSISSNVGRMEFVLQDREDIDGSKALSRINVYSKNSDLLKSFNFSYDYFVSPARLDGIEEKRLKLETIHENINSNIKELYDFDYQTRINLPIRTSPDFDHWGYYNHAMNNSYIPKLTDRNGIFHDGADREPHPEWMKANVLLGYTTPLGGYIHIKVEPHSYLVEDNTQIAGGLRVHSMKYFQVKGDITAARDILYTYNKSGQLYNKPKYNSYVMLPISMCACEYLYIHSHSLNDIFDMNGYHMGYSHVTISDNGTQDFYYTNFSEFPDIKAKKYQRYTYVIPGIGPSGNPIYLPFGGTFTVGRDYIPCPDTYKGWNRGLLQKNISKDNSGMVIEEIEYVYSEEFEPGLKSVGLRVEERVAPNNGILQYWFFLGSYENVSAYQIVLDKLIRKSYRNTNIIETTTNYLYNSIHQVKSTTMIDSYKDEIEITYKYPSDYPTPLFAFYNTEGRAIDKMKDLHILNKPIETVRYENSKVIGAKLNAFKYDSDKEIVVPYYESSIKIPEPLAVGSANYWFTPSVIKKNSFANWKFIQDNHYTQDISYDVFDANGNLLQYHSIDDMNNSIVWGYNGQYPVAKVVNMAYSTITGNTVLKNYLNQLDDYTIITSTNSAGFKTLNNNIRGQIPAGAQITTYTYDPLVGMTSVTDPDGITTTYEYDEFGRLKLTKDQNGNIIERNTYNYITQP